MSGAVAEFTDAGFQAEVLDAAGPVLVDFWAPWCGPCKMLTPTIEDLAGEYEGRVSVGKLNTDENPTVAAQYEIRSIPTVMVFKGGEVVETLQGLMKKEQYASALDKHLA